MVTLKIGLLQIAPSGADVQANLSKGLAACDRASEMGADIVVFPEMWSVGYSEPEEVGGLERWQALAIQAEGPFLDAFRSKATDLDLAIAVTYLERCEPQPCDTVSVIDSSGEIALTYRKVHTCDFGMEAHILPGDSFPVATVCTAVGPVQIGAMICYDLDYPESARLLMLGGAEVVVVPNCCDMNEHKLAALRTRAYENMVAVALANYPMPIVNGQSAVFTGVACTQELEGDGEPLDIQVALAGREEAIILAELDLEGLRSYRARETLGDAYRKPRTYGALLDDSVREPFLRPDSRR